MFINVRAAVAKIVIKLNYQKKGCEWKFTAKNFKCVDFVI
jgi:hypothetical protein